MSHFGASPIGHEQIKRSEFGKIVSTRGPSLCEVAVTAPFEVSYVRQSQHVAVKRSCDLPGDIWRPIGMVLWLNCGPPDQNRAIRHNETDKCWAAQTTEDRGDRGDAKQDKQAYSETSDKFLSRETVPQSKRRPSCYNGNQ